MTGDEMNGRAGKNLSSWVALVGAAATVGGCMGSFQTKTASDSPLSHRVEALVDANRAYPQWADFPGAPTPAPSQARVDAQVAVLGRQAGEVGARAAAIDWTLNEPDAFAAAVQRRSSAPVSASVARTAAEVEAFARGLRERATAPPPVDP